MPGTVVTLSVAAGAGSKLSNRGGAFHGTGTCQVAMDAAKAVSANSPFAVATVTGSASGTVQDGLGTGAVLQGPRG